jgi:hypothetical protein
MKPFLSLIPLCLIVATCYGQPASIDTPNLKLKRGIYLSFAEINAGVPARMDSFFIKDGSSTPLTRKTLMKLLSKYPDIAKEFQNKTDILEYTIPIISAINQKEKD